MIYYGEIFTSIGSFAYNCSSQFSDMHPKTTSEGNQLSQLTMYTCAAVAACTSRFNYHDVFSHAQPSSKRCSIAQRIKCTVRQSNEDAVQPFAPSTIRCGCDITRRPHQTHNPDHDRHIRRQPEYRRAWQTVTDKPPAKHLALRRCPSPRSNPARRLDRCSRAARGLPKRQGRGQPIYTWKD